MVWIKFLICLVVILFAGTRLARYADAVSEKTHLGRIWIGMLLLAMVTSMPEMVTSISSVTLVGKPDLALGTVLGSCIFNLAIIAVLDVIFRWNPVLSRASRIHILSGSFAILLLAVPALSILGGPRFDRLTLGWVGLPSFIILIIYLIGARLIYRAEQSKNMTSSQEDLSQYQHLSSRAVFIRFGIAALAIIGAGIWLSFIGDEIALTYSWSASFVGSLFLAITTSVPELVVTTTAIRLNAVDMAIGDIVGANMLDIVAIAVSDIFFTRGPLLFQPRSLVSGAHVTTAIVAIVMTLVVMAGLRFQNERKLFYFMHWYTPILIGLYVYGAYMVFNSGL